MVFIQEIEEGCTNHSNPKTFKNKLLLMINIARVIIYVANFQKSINKIALKEKTCMKWKSLVTLSTMNELKDLYTSLVEPVNCGAKYFRAPTSLGWGSESKSSVLWNGPIFLPFPFGFIIQYFYIPIKKCLIT